jgi:superfamily II DNA or RNA helicase
MRPIYAERFEEFQKPAIENIVSDFSANPKGRFLLVIPTGGGKTRTAVKSVLALYERGVLDPLCDKVLWVAHRNYLFDASPGRRL